MLPQLSNSNDSIVMRAKKGTVAKGDEMFRIPSMQNVEERIGEESKSSFEEGTGSSKDHHGPSSLTSNKYIEAPKESKTEVNLFSQFQQIAAQEKLTTYEAYKNSFEGSGGSPTFNTELHKAWDGVDDQNEEIRMVQYYDGQSDEDQLNSINHGQQ